MRRRRFEIDYELRLTGDRCFCGAGVGRSGVDRTFLRDEREQMFVPGSHLKGLVRQRCEELLALLGVDSADPHDQSRPAPADDPIGRLFGRPGPADLASVFSDARASAPFEQVTATRNRVRMNRRLGRPEHQGLFDTEYAVPPPDVPLRASVVTWLEVSDEAELPKELALLCGGLRLIDAVGGDRSTGAGSAEVRITAIRAGDQEIELAQALASLGEPSWFDERQGGAS